MISRLAAIALFIILSVGPAINAPAQITQVEVFSPQGVVKKVRQVSVRFSGPMVAFGDLRLEAPFIIDCLEKGKGRWADDRNWVYDFDRDLPAGVVCNFRLRDGLADVKGSEVGGQRVFSFSTGGPAVIRSMPYEGDRSIEEEQAFVLTLDCPATEQSVLENAYFSVSGINERVGLRIVKGAVREELLRAVSSRWRPVPDEPETLIIQAKQYFPNLSDVRLIWGAGISSSGGVKTEKDQVLPFKTRGPFKAMFTCSRENPEADCIPFLPMVLNFASPVIREDAARIRLVSGDKVYEPQTGDSEYVRSVSFVGPFPENATFRIEMPEGLRDDAGRLLENTDKFPLEVKTDRYPPLAKFSARFGIIEKADPVLPVTLRNIEPIVTGAMLEAGGTALKNTQFGEVSGKARRIDDDKDIIDWLRKVGKAGRGKSILKAANGAWSFKLPRPGGADSFEVVGIPLAGTGLYVVELESNQLGEALLGKKAPMYVQTSALVTNLSAHFKWGRESSLVWVTRLDNGLPVEGARVAVRNCEGGLLWEGVTDRDGVAYIDEELPKDLPSCYGEWGDEAYLDYSQSRALGVMSGGLFVFARTDDDMTFVHSNWNEGIETWRFGLPFDSGWRGPVTAETVFDRPLFRAGETVSMKHVLRKRVMSGFRLVDNDKLPKAVSVVHMGSDQSYDFPLEWDTESGIAQTVWNIPEDAKLGHYEVRLLKELPKDSKQGDVRYSRDYQSAGRFRVEEFRVPLMKGVIQPPKQTFVNMSCIDVDIQVAYLSGGGASDLPVVLRSRSEGRSVYFEDYQNFVFANGKVEEGIVKLYGEKANQAPKPEVYTRNLALGEGGALRARINGIPIKDTPQNILAEVEYRDPNGEVQTVSRTIPVWSSEIVVGIKPDSWANSKEQFKFQVAALDTSGKPVPGVEVKVDAFEVKTYSHRRRLIGGFYSYEHVVETKKVAQLCEGVTDEKGILRCEVVSPVPGELVLQASAKDRLGNETAARRTVWVAGDKDWWFDISDNDRIDVIPESKRYEPGDTAAFQVRMPFRDATALVTIEREGVMDSFVTRLSGKEPIVRVAVKDNYAPNVFVSVLCVRGRSDEFKPTALVDLGRPAYKLGMTQINVGWKAHELSVDVSTKQDVFKVREKVPVKIKVVRADGGKLPPGAEVAIAAVDEGLLELKDNDSWKLLENMMATRSCEVTTSTAQMQVVGKRHYGLKAQPSGGGGGRQRTRELFDTLLYWKGRVPLNSSGEAEVTIPLNDSLSSFRIVAVANAGTGLFGTGNTNIRTTQDLMLMSGLPQMVREGDNFRAVFTVRNASENGMNVTVTAKVVQGKGAVELEERTLNIPAGAAREASWDEDVPYGIDGLKWEVTARSGGTASDSLRAFQKVVPAVPVRIFQATLRQLDGQSDMEVEQPPDALPGRGGVRVSLRARLSDELDGVWEYMRLYPYCCLEQKVSKAVALRDQKMWDDLAANIPSYMDSDGLLKYFPTCRYGSDSLTAYVLSISNEAGWKIPDGALQKILGGMEGFVTGRVVRYSSMPTVDLALRKMAAVEAISRYGKAKPKHLDSIAIEPNLWPTSGVIDWLNVLTQLNDVPDRDSKQEIAKQVLRARLNFQGTTMGFSTEGMDYLWWLMVNADVNAVRMLLSVMTFDDWRVDMPRLIRGAVGRQHRGRWITTTANAWGVLALEKFAAEFESVPVTGKTSALLAGAGNSLDWSAEDEGGSMMFGWPHGKEELSVSHQGTGKPWMTVQSLAAIPIKEPLSSGYKIVKKITPVIRKEEWAWSAGDVARVRLECEAQADMTWVVVSDPVPAGSTLLGGGLGNDSRILASGEKNEGWVWPAFEERSFEAFRAYFEFVPKGKWVVEYTVRFNNPGVFVLPATRVEALYSPEMFGEIPNEKFKVNQ